MIGPKLDSRSYTTLLLVVVASLLTLNLVAQVDFSQRSVRANEPAENLSEAGSSANIAAANREIASANREIAASIRQLAQAVSRLELNVTVPSSGGTGAGQASGSGNAASQSASDPMSVPANATIPYQGTLNIN